MPNRSARRGTGLSGRGGFAPLACSPAPAGVRAIVAGVLESRAQDAGRSITYDVLKGVNGNAIGILARKAHRADLR